MYVCQQLPEGSSKAEADSLSHVVPWCFVMNNALSLSLRKAGEITFPPPKGAGV